MNRKAAVEKVFTDKEKPLISNIFESEKSSQTDAIIVFTGYGPELMHRACDLWKSINDENKPHIIIVGPDSLPRSGNAKFDDKPYEKLTAEDYVKFIYKNIDNNFPKEKIIEDHCDKTKQTNGQADTVAEIIKIKNWKTVVLVVAAYHMPRAYMTLLKSLINHGLIGREKLVNIISHPYENGNAFDWDIYDSVLKDCCPWVKKLEVERCKIYEYQNKGNVATWEELKMYFSFK